MKLAKNHIVFIIFLFITIIFYSAFHLYKAASIESLLSHTRHKDGMLKFYYSLTDHGFEKKLIEETFRYLPNHFLSDVHYADQNNQQIDLACYTKFTDDDSAQDTG